MQRELNQPLGGNDMPRFGGIATMMRLPQATSTEGLDACFVGVPLDLGTSNRSGARFGPRQIRSESVLLRPYNMATRAGPVRCADVERHAHEADVEPFRGLGLRQAHHGGDAAEPRHLVAAQRLVERALHLTSLRSLESNRSGDGRGDPARPNIEVEMFTSMPVDVCASLIG